MRAFAFARPDSIDDVVRRLSDGAVPLAGGTDLLSLMKQGVERPNELVSLSGVEALRGVSGSPGRGFRFGAATPLSEVLAHPGVRRDLPALVTALEGIGAPQILSRGSVGGDLLQRPRCWYYRAGFGLLAEKDGRSMVRDGDHRYHAIYGTEGKALFVHPSSIAPILIALGAEVDVRSVDGSRSMPLEDLYRAPAEAGERELTLAPNELLERVRLPAGRIEHQGVHEVRPLEGLDWPLVSAAIAHGAKGMRVVLGHVAPVPWRSRAAEAILSGDRSPDRLRAAAAAAAEEARPLPGNRYKVRLVQTAIRRAGG